MRLILAGLLFAVAQFSFAQSDSIPAKKESAKPLLYYFKNGKSGGHLRHYFMSTDNEAGLTDYYANAFGGGLRFETASFHGFHFGVAGFYIFNIGSSDMTKKDRATGQISRYESGQFDVTNLSNKHDLDRLEELYLKYETGKTTITGGRQNIKSPFINPQDGRMRPTAESGIWVESLGDIKNLEFKAGIFNDISPKGTVNWYSIGHSIGIYSTGVDEKGKKSAYANAVHSEFIGLVSLQYNWGKSLKIQGWNQWVDNVFNTALFQTDGNFSISGKWRGIYGLQYIHQNTVGQGGNANPDLAYASKDWQSNIFGGKAGVKNEGFETSVSYTRITKDGRFLMPREWGKEPLFTFMPRERNEGAGDVHAWVYRISNHFEKLRLNPEISAGYYRMPDVRNYRLNKYGMPSYWQTNLSVLYEFEGFMKGLDAQLIVVYKGKIGETYEVPGYTFNKVNMMHTNVILNYHF
jgi:hypothetical protein